MADDGGDVKWMAKLCVRIKLAGEQVTLILTNYRRRIHLNLNWDFGSLSVHSLIMQLFELNSPNVYAPERNMPFYIWKKIQPPPKIVKLN